MSEVTALFQREAGSCTPSGAVLSPHVEEQHRAIIVIGNLQILRAFAATGVVFLHSNAAVFGVHTEFHGVALFFVLSGYLMCRISNRSAVEFVRDRFWRIVPVYWMATAIMLTTFGMWTYWPAAHIFMSFLFLPHQAPSGLHPVLGVGWTLNFEVYFYTVFALSIFIAKKHAPALAASTIAFVFFATPLVTESEALRFYYGGKSVWFFVAGIGIWYLTEAMARWGVRRNLPKLTLPVALAVYAAASVVSGALWASPEQAFYAAIVLAPSLFLTAVLAAQSGADLKPSFLILLGNASYGCYLLHTILIELMRHRGVAIDGGLSVTLYILLASWTIAILWYLFVERLLAAVIRSRRTRALSPALHSG